MASLFSRHAPFAALVLTSIAPLTSGTRVVFSGLFDAGIVDFTPRDGTLKNASQHVEGIFDARSSASISIASDLNEAATSIKGASATTRNASTTGAETKPACKKDDTGLAVGCHLNCHCGWGEQCYAKWWPPEAQLSVQHNKQASSGRENRGVCQTAMPVLAFASFIIFSVVLTFFVGVRTFLQWRALEDDHDAQFFIKTLSTNASKSLAHDPLRGLKVNSLSGVLQKSAPRPGDSEDSDGGDDAPARAKLEAGKESKDEGPVAAAACDEEEKPIAPNYM